MPPSRIPIAYNAGYKANGLKSYIYALNKYNFTPQHTTLFRRDGQKKLIMKAADGADHEVTSANQQNDAFFTTPVSIGTPPQTLQLVRSLSFASLCSNTSRTSILVRPIAGAGPPSFLPP